MSGFLSKISSLYLNKQPNKLQKEHEKQAEYIASLSFSLWEYGALPPPIGMDKIDLTSEEARQSFEQIVIERIRSMGLIDATREEKAKLIRRIAKHYRAEPRMVFREKLDAHLVIELMLNANTITQHYFELFPDSRSQRELIKNLAEIVPAGLNVIFKNDLPMEVQVVFPYLTELFQMNKYCYNTSADTIDYLRVLEEVPKASQKEEKTVVTNIAAMLAVITSTDVSKTISKWTEKIFEGPATIYDKAADATYNRTHEGGALHRLFDGGHSPGDLWDAVKEASPNDSRAAEVAGYIEAFFKDVSTINGLPFITLSKENYDEVAQALEKSFGIPKQWSADVASFNLVELFGTSLGVIALAMNWNKNDQEQFYDMATSLGIAAGFSANPLLGIVALASLAKAFRTPKETFDYSKLIKGAGKGGIGTVLILMASNIIAGPTWIGLIVGLILGVYARQKVSEISLESISNWIETIFNDATKTMKKWEEIG